MGRIAIDSQFLNDRFVITFNYVSFWVEGSGVPHFNPINQAEFCPVFASEVRGIVRDQDERRAIEIYPTSLEATRNRRRFRVFEGPQISPPGTEVNGDQDVDILPWCYR